MAISFMGWMAAIGLALGGTAAAQAQVTYRLTNVPLGPSFRGVGGAGTLNGYFVTDDAGTMLLNYDILATPATPIGESFAGFEYTPQTATSAATILQDRLLELQSPDGQDTLILRFLDPLSGLGATIVPVTSYETEPPGAERFPSGTVTASSAVPESSTWIMIMVGLGVTGGMLRSRRTITRASLA